MSDYQNTPKGKQIERDIREQLGGSYKFHIPLDRVAWGNVSDELPSYILKRGKSAALSWLYKLVKENYHEDGRKRCNHYETLKILYIKILRPDHEDPKVSDFVKRLRERQLSRAGRKAGLKSGEQRKI